MLASREKQKQKNNNDVLLSYITLTVSMGMITIRKPAAAALAAADLTPMFRSLVDSKLFTKVSIPLRRG